MSINGRIGRDVGARGWATLAITGAIALAGAVPAHAEPGPSACPFGRWQWSESNLSVPGQRLGPVRFAGSWALLRFRCKYGDPGAVYPIDVCVRGPGALRCRRRVLRADLFGAATVIRTSPYAGGTYRWSVAPAPGGPVVMRSRFRTFVGE